MGFKAFTGSAAEVVSAAEGCTTADDAKADTQALADLLKVEGLPAHLELWGGDVSHEWYWWGKMLGLFVPRILEK